MRLILILQHIDEQWHNVVVHRSRRKGEKDRHYYKYTPLRKRIVLICPDLDKFRSLRVHSSTQLLERLMHLNVKIEGIIEILKDGKDYDVCQVSEVVQKCTI